MKTTLLLMVAFPAVLLMGLCAAVAEVDHVAGHHILKQMGAEGRFVFPEYQLQLPSITKFRKLDTDESWTLSVTELTGEDVPADQRISAQLFKAADLDRDGVVSQDEYREYLVIHDEAVEIFSRLDKDGDSRVSRDEFMAGSRIEDDGVARDAFVRFDTGQDGSLALAEVLPVWDAWARQEPPPVTARLIVKQSTYVLPREHATDAFRKRIKSETDSEKLPPAPRVNLILELTNTGTAALGVWPGGGIDDPVVMVQGDGLVRPENLEGGGGSSGVTTPQPVIQPGKTFRVKVRSLNPEGGGFDNVYWTKPGEYQISASYPVYQNLPPHLPQLFPNQPQPTGKRKRFIVTSPAVTVVVKLDD